MKKIISALICLLIAAVPALAEFTLPPVAEFAGGSIAYEDAYAQFETTLRSYSDFGWGSAAADMEETAMTVLRSMVEQAVLRNKAQELGLMEVSEEKMAELRASADALYEQQIAYYIDFYTSEGMSAEDARIATMDALREDGVSAESLLQEMLDNQWYSALYEYVSEGVVIDETHILAYAESLAETQALDWAEDPINFDYLYMNDDLIAWYPPDVRCIKHVLIGFDAEQSAAYEALVGDGAVAEADPAALDALYAPLQDRADEVLRRLDAGEAFDDVMRECGDDEFMRHEPYSLTGYLVQPGSQLFVSEFVDACFALENVGDISAPVRTAGGLHIILYAGDATSGSVPLAEIADLVALEAQDQLISDTFDAQAAAWVEEAQPVYYPEYLLQ